MLNLITKYPYRASMALSALSFLLVFIVPTTPIIVINFLINLSLVLFINKAIFTNYTSKGFGKLKAQSIKKILPDLALRVLVPLLGLISFSFLMKLSEIDPFLRVLYAFLISLSYFFYIWFDEKEGSRKDFDPIFAVSRWSLTSVIFAISDLLVWTFTFTINNSTIRALALTSALHLLILVLSSVKTRSFSKLTLLFLMVFIAVDIYIIRYANISDFARLFTVLSLNFFHGLGLEFANKKIYSAEFFTVYMLTLISSIALISQFTR